MPVEPDRAEGRQGLDSDESRSGKNCCFEKPTKNKLTLSCNIVTAWGNVVG